MTGQRFTRVDTGGGSTHTGSGDQYNGIHFHLPHDPGPDPFRPLAADHLEWLRRRFVPPARMPAEQARLTRLGTLLVDGAPGSGRGATARMLLHGIGGPRVPRQLLAENDEAELDLRDEHVGEGERLLLDLSDADGRMWETVRGKLPSLHHTVREREAHLVVILPHGLRPPGNELAAHRYAVVRPDGMSVLMRALRMEEDPPAESPDELTPEVREYVEAEPPLRDIARLAGLVIESRRAKPREDVKHWCTDALTSLRELGRVVAEQIGELSTGRQRALLLTTAMLPGARTVALHSAEELLLREVRQPSDERPLLDREDLSQRVKAIGASVRSDDTVEFGLPGYAAAVRSHFWTHRPGLWHHFRLWVDGAVRLDVLGARDRDTLVAGYAEQTLRTGQRRQLLAQARRWSEAESPELVQAAVQALGLGLSDPHAGRDFRQQVYHWCTEKQIPAGLLRALVAVSADVIADSHPDQALVRLHHLARRADAGNLTADERLLDLALADRRLRRKLLQRLADGLEQKPWPADARLFRSAAAPERVTAFLHRPEERKLLVRAWRALLLRRDTAEWLPQVRDWLAAARAGDPHGDVLLDLLVLAAAPSPTVLAHLYRTSPPYPCSAALRRRIDAAQGIRPASSPF